MTIKQRLISICAVIPLAGCSASSQMASGRLATDLRDNVYNTSERLQKWVLTKPEKPQPKPVAASYCYNVYQDILCYRSPMPGWENRLAGYQGTNALPPMPAQMEPLPIHTADTSKIPTKRIADAKPVYVKIPEAPKPAVAAEGGVVIQDSAHEQLPNPAITPQL